MTRDSAQPEQQTDMHDHARHAKPDEPDAEPRLAFASIVKRTSLLNGQRWAFGAFIVWSPDCRFLFSKDYFDFLPIQSLSAMSNVCIPLCWRMRRLRCIKSALPLI
jgi:hypothetical protein